MTPERRRQALKWAATAVAAAVTTGSFLAVPKIAKALPASFTALLMLTPPRSPVVALRPEPKPHESIAPEESDETESSFPEEESSQEPSPLPPEDAITVMADSFCWYEAEEEPTLDLINRTKYKVDVPSYLKESYPIKPLHSPSEQEPLVLIIHTHGSEAYLPDGTDYYLPGEDFRSENPEETVVAVGAAIAQTLKELGIPALHDTTMHDTENFNHAYSNSAKAVAAYLEQYPSIRYVLDVHRDSIFDGDTCEKTLTTVQDKQTAQVMLVVGTDESGSSHPGWRKNFTVAAHLEEQLNRLYPTLARPVNLREHGFNQWLSPGSLIVEVGSCGNTREEAVTAGVFFAKAFAALAKEKG